MIKSKLALYAAVIFIMLGVAMIVTSLTSVKEPREYHIHADFRVYLNGTAWNFSQEKYVSDESKVLDPVLHLHDMDGNVIHQHAEGVTLGDFFRSLNMTFNSTCFVPDDGTEYCENLKMFVQHEGEGWEQNPEYGDYELQDIDRILITDSIEEDAIKEQMDSVTDMACIQSGTCPERGPPVGESSCSGEVCLV